MQVAAICRADLTREQAIAEMSTTQEKADGVWDSCVISRLLV